MAHWTANYALPYERGMEISAIIQQLVAAFGSKQDELAKALGVTQPTVSRWIKGSDPKGRTRDRILDLARRHGLVPDPSAAQSRKSAGAAKFASVPVVSWVSAGQLADTGGDTHIQEAQRIAVSGLGDGDFFAVRVQGTSMDRISPEKSLIVVNRAEKALHDGKPYIFAIRGETTYKLWRASPPRLEPFSTDPSHEPIFLDKRQKALVIGRVRRSILEL